MKKTTVLLLILSLPFILNAQTAYYDALELSKHMIGSDLDFGEEKVYEILDKYHEPQVNNTKQQIYDAFNENPVSDPNPFIEITGGMRSSLGGLAQTGKGFSLSSIGGLDVTNIAKGISLFMIDRAEQELTAAFFERFNKYVHQNPEIQVLFPKTTIALSNLISFHYTEMLPVLKQSFYEDFKLLPIHLNDILELPEYRILLAEFPEIRISFRTINLIYTLENGENHPSDILNDFADFPEWDETTNSIEFKNFGNTVKTANIISQSLRSTPEDTVNAWVNPKDINALINNGIAFQIYMGLIYHQLKTEKITFYSTKEGKAIDLNEFLNNKKETILMFQNYVSEFILLTEKVDRQIGYIKNKEKEKHTNKDYYEYIKTSIDVIEYGFKITTLLNEDIDFENYLLIANNSTDLYKNVYEENYPAALSNAVSIISTTCEILNYNMNKQEFRTLITSDLQSVSAISEIKNYDSKDFANKINKSDFNWNDKSRLINKEIEKLKELKNQINIKEDDKILIENAIKRTSLVLKTTALQNTVSNIRKYGLFMANIVEAETPEAVQSAIESAVLPVGSSSLKKHSAFNVSVQSYLGASFNTNASDNYINAWNGKFGITAPIGISFSNGWNNRGSLGLFISLIDLGAIVDYEYNTDTSFSTSVSSSSLDTTTVATVNSKNDYKVELGQIFSPGFYITYGFPIDIPIALSFGAQYGPGLIKINSNDTKLTDPDWKFVLTLTVDIPWFTIYNIEKKKIKSYK